jgi:hypothetical protein
MFNLATVGASREQNENFIFNYAEAKPNFAVAIATANLLFFFNMDKCLVFLLI